MTADTGRVSFGIKTSQAGTTYDQILRTWREAEAVPEFEHAWLWDHLVPLRGEVTGPALEAWTLLAGLAAQTSRLRLGVIVTSNRIRPPAVLAKMAATVDIIAGGRLVFGIGAGGSELPDPALAAMVHREYDAFGIDVVTPGEAQAALSETCTLVRKLWAEEQPFDFEGRCYRLKGAVCEPKPVQRPGPPVMIGAGAGPSALRIVARHADIWVSPAVDAPDFRRKNAALDQRCAAIGRDPAEITRSAQVVFNAQEPPPGGSSRFPGPAGARELLAGLIDAGARHLVLGPIGAPSPQWVADEIIRPVLATVGHADLALSAFGLGLEPGREDDGGGGCVAPAQGMEEVTGPDQAALADLVPRIPAQELDPRPEAGLVVPPGARRVVRIVNALAADVAALDNAGAAFLHHFPDQALFQRFARLNAAAEQVPVPLATAIPGAQNDHPGLGEADPVGLIGVRRLRPERRIEPGEGHPAALLGELLDGSRLRFGQAP